MSRLYDKWTDEDFQIYNRLNLRGRFTSASMVRLGDHVDARAMLRLECDRICIMPAPRPIARMAVALAHQPEQGPAPGDQVAYFPGAALAIEGLADSLFPLPQPTRH